MKKATLKRSVALGQGTQPIQCNPTGKGTAGEYMPDLTLLSTPAPTLLSQLSISQAQQEVRVQGSGGRRDWGAKRKYSAQE